MKVKMVRDNMATILADDPDWDHAKVRPVNGKEGHLALLLLKLHEESQEVAGEPTDPAEYADLLEVVFALMALNGVSWASVEGALLEKREMKGSFHLGMVLVED